MTTDREALSAWVKAYRNWHNQPEWPGLDTDEFRAVGGAFVAAVNVLSHPPEPEPPESASPYWGAVGRVVSAHAAHEETRPTRTASLPDAAAEALARLELCDAIDALESTLRGERLARGCSETPPGSPRGDCNVCHDGIRTSDDWVCRDCRAAGRGDGWPDGTEGGGER